MTLRRPLLAALVLVGVAVSPGRSQDFPAVVTECWVDVRLFDSLSTGPVDYCRGHLRYVPGTLDCYQMIDRVCLVLVPVTGELIDTRSPRTKIPFICPPGRPPPVCRRLDLQ